MSREGSLPEVGVGEAGSPLRDWQHRMVPVEPGDSASRPELDVYDHFQMGLELLETGNPAQAALRLEKARMGAPKKMSVREALGRAYFAMGRWSAAEEEFRAVVDEAPTNDYAHYCLARSLQRQGRHADARPHLNLARAMRPSVGEEEEL